MKNLPAFNDYTPGFYTMEFDLFTYPGVAFPISSSVTIGLSLGGGVRLPVLVKLDSNIIEANIAEAFGWFYNDFAFIYWGGQIFTEISLPLNENTKFYADIHYKDFIFRTNQWLIGATIGLLWHIN